MAGKAECRRLLLTHFYPACRGQDLLTPCQKFYPGPILLATDGLRMQV
jgi:ribonuclease BN (tRNA processing enzyme)